MSNDRRYKPVGYGKEDKILNTEMKSVLQLLENILLPHTYRIEIDTCFTSALVKYVDVIPKESIDAREVATFSMYIDSELNCYPCSFGIWEDVEVESCRDKRIKDVWNGTLFSAFRNKRKLCVECDAHELCRGGCGLDLGIELCGES